jgi:lactoylglutathione lyase
MKSMKQSLDAMNLGAFSMSLAVKNLEASRRFYEKLGFKIFARDALKLADPEERRPCPRPVSRDVRKDRNLQKLDVFTDVRDLQRQLKAQGVMFQTEVDEASTGPASFMILDP